MPFLDVSEVLTDPDFADDTLVRVRQVQDVGDNGRATNTPEETDFTAVVVQDAGAMRRLVPEASIVDGSILIYSPLPLTAGDADQDLDADQIVWGAKEKTYIVDKVGDYTTYGAGFVWAICIPKAISG